MHLKIMSVLQKIDIEHPDRQIQVKVHVWENSSINFELFRIGNETQSIFGINHVPAGFNNTIVDINRIIGEISTNGTAINGSDPMKCDEPKFRDEKKVFGEK